MKTITSIKNAIAYFKNGSRTHMSKSVSGQIYATIIPPVGFRTLKVIDEKGFVFTFTKNMFQNFASILENGTINGGNRIVAIKLFHL